MWHRCDICEDYQRPSSIETDTFYAITLYTWRFGWGEEKNDVEKKVKIAYVKTNL